MDAFYWLRYTPARLLALIGFAVNKSKFGSKASFQNQGNQLKFFFFQKGPDQVKLNTGAHV